MDQLFIRLATDPAQTLHWVQRHGMETGPVQAGGFEAAAEAGRGRQVILLIPAEQALLKKADVPARQTSQLLRAVPYALEDELAADLAELHFALGPREADMTTVAVVERRLMEGWIGLCRAHEIHPQAILPDVLCLPLEENSWSILLEPERALVRTGMHSGFSCERDLLDILLAAELEISQPDNIRVWLCDGEEARLVVPADDVTTQALACDQGPLEVLAKGWQPQQGINLQQGEFKNRPDYAKKLQPWRWAAVLFGIWLVFSFAGMLLEQSQLNKQRNELDSKLKSEFTRIFPGSKNTSNMRVRVERELKALQGGGKTSDADMLTLLAASGRVINENKDAKLESINFRNNRLELKITAASLSQLDAIKNAIAKEASAKAELSSADSDKDRASGQIRISR